MGNCLSKTNGDDSRENQPVPNLPTISPPTYTHEHNDSCNVLKPWMDDGGKSRGYRYIVFVNNNNLLNKDQHKAQDLILEFIKQCAAIHGFPVWVKCLDYLSGEASDADAEKEKHFYKDMLATDTKSKMIKMWNEYAKNLVSLHEQSTPEEETLKSSEREINVAIKRMQNDKELDDSDAKSQIESELVAALSRFNQGWKLNEFLAGKTQIFEKPCDIDAERISKLQAQFYLQARATFASLIALEGSVPTVAIHIVPDENWENQPTRSLYDAAGLTRY